MPVCCGRMCLCLYTSGSATESTFFTVALAEMVRRRRGDFFWPAGKEAQDASRVSTLQSRRLPLNHQGPFLMESVRSRSLKHTAASSKCPSPVLPPLFSAGPPNPSS